MTYCLVEEASCQCARKKGHRKPHRCRCEGEWWVTRRGQFVLYELPNPMAPFILAGGEDTYGRLSNEES